MIDDKMTNSKQTPATEQQKSEQELPENVVVVGVTFRNSCKSYWFAPGSFELNVGDVVIVDTQRGPEIGTVNMPSKTIKSSEVILPLRSVCRLATPDDMAHMERNRKLEQEATEIFRTKVEAHHLEMDLVSVEYTFDNTKLLFYYTAENRVDFRELVKDLASVFKTRIELRQIGIRDKAKMVGGIGSCGMPFCCTTFLSDFAQVSIKMAKEQNFSLNSSKISGTCGRLMCCLRYEHETYEAALKTTPSVGSAVETDDGTGVVTETRPLAQQVKVRLDAESKDAPKCYSCDSVRIISKQRQSQSAKEENGGGKSQTE